MAVPDRVAVARRQWEQTGTCGIEDCPTCDPNVIRLVAPDADTDARNLLDSLLAHELDIGPNGFRSFARRRPA